MPSINVMNRFMTLSLLLALAFPVLGSLALASPMEKLELKCDQEIFEKAGLSPLSEECEHAKLQGSKICAFAAEKIASSSFLSDCDSAQSLGAGICTAVTLKMGRTAFVNGCENYSSLGSGLCAAAAVRNGLNPTSAKCARIETTEEGNCAVRALNRGRGRIVSILHCLETQSSPRKPSKSF